MYLSLPDFLGIGALKAATTYLDSLLRQHPEVCLPPGVKEVQFFNRHFDRGAQWYARHFEACGTRRRGEISPQYLFDPACPGRIAELLPDVRLIVSVRDPVERAYSQYKHWVQERGYAKPFEAFLVEHPGALARGEYFGLLSRYLERFPNEQLRVVVTEELVSDPHAVLPAILAFIDVDAAWTPPQREPPRNVSAVPRFHPVYVGAKRVTRWFDRRAGARVVEAAKRAGAARVFRDRRGSRSFLPLEPDTAARLRRHYAADVAQLSGLLDRDLAAYWWRDP